MSTQLGTPGPTPAVGVAQVGLQGLYPGHNQPECCEVCRGYGHSPRMFPILQKYSNVTNNNYCELFSSTTHHTDQCRALDSLADKSDRSTFQVNETSQGG